MKFNYLNKTYSKSILTIFCGIKGAFNYDIVFKCKHYDPLSLLFDEALEEVSDNIILSIYEYL